MKYSEYLKTEKWFKIRTDVFVRDKFCCKRCGKKFSLGKLECHHLTYKHKENEENYLEDLITLCNNCHRIITNNREENLKLLIKLGHKIKKL